MTTQAGIGKVGIDESRLGSLPGDEQTVTVAEAACILGRDRTRVYALLRLGDLVAAPDDEGGAGPVRILRASLESEVEPADFSPARVRLVSVRPGV